MEKESNSKTEKDDISEKIMKLFGEATDYIKELTDSNVEDKEINVKEGEFLEKYFNEKLKYLLKSKNAFSSLIDISQIEEEMILSINYALLNNSSLDEKTAKKIIRRINKCFKDETKVQIDSLLPMVEGKDLNTFFDSIKNYSFPSTNKIENDKVYTLIVESTFSLSSQIVKKSSQLRKSFLLFSLIHKLYLAYPDYIKNFYKYFVQKYLLRQNVNRKMLESEKEEEDVKLDLSRFGNYVFIIASNKTLKSFQETEYLVENNYFKEEDKEDSPDTLLTKCFKDDDESISENIILNKKIPKNPIKDNLIGKHKIQEGLKSNDKKMDFNEITKKISKDPLLLKAFKELNYLIENINQEDNCIVKVIYLDTYLNMTTPKCEVVKEIQKLTERVNFLMDFLSKQYPQFMELYQKTQK